MRTKSLSNWDAPCRHKLLTNTSRDDACRLVHHTCSDHMHHILLETPVQQRVHRRFLSWGRHSDTYQGGAQCALHTYTHQPSCSRRLSYSSSRCRIQRPIESRPLLCSWTPCCSCSSCFCFCSLGKDDERNTYSFEEFSLHRTFEDDSLESFEHQWWCLTSRRARRRRGG